MSRLLVLSMLILTVANLQAREQYNFGDEPLPQANAVEYTKLPEPSKEKTVTDILPPHTVVFFDYIYQSDTDFDDQFGSFELNEFRAGIEPVFTVTESLYLGVGVYYTGYNFRFDVRDFNETRSLHALTFPVSLSFISDKWLVSGFVTPGFYSDFRGLNDDDFQVTGGGLIGYLLHPTFFLQAGVISTNDFSDVEVIPIGGFVWKPNDSFDVSALIPISADINYHFDDRTTFFLTYELDGNLYHYRFRDINGRTIEDDAQFTFYRVGVGFKYYFTRGVAVEGVVGAHVGGEYEFSEVVLPEDKGNIESALYVMFSLTIDERLFREPDSYKGIKAFVK